jgi:hypothetical protein
VYRHFKRLLAVWFVLQITLPFTAPLQTCDLGDLLGTKRHHTSPTSPESSTTPTTSEAESDGNTFVSPVESSALRASTGLVAACDLAFSGPAISTLALLPSPQVQRTILRL